MTAPDSKMVDYSFDLRCSTSTDAQKVLDLHVRGPIVHVQVVTFCYLPLKGKNYYFIFLLKINVFRYVVVLLIDFGPTFD